MADLGKRYSRNLMGINAQGFVDGTDAIITSGKTVKDIVHDTAILKGTIGIVADGLSNINALAAGEKFQIVQKIGYVGDDSIVGELSSSIELVWGSDVVVTKTAYDAPAIQVDEAAIAAADIDTLLTIPGLKEFVSAARDTTPVNQPFPVEEGRSVVRNATTAAYDMLVDLVKNINGDWDYERNSDDLFAVATITNTAPVGLITVAASAFLAQGSNVASFNAAPTGPVAGEYISFEVPGTSVADVFKIVDFTGVYVTLDRVWQHPDAGIPIADMLVGAAVSGDWTLGFIGTTNDTHFSSIVSEDLGDFQMLTTQAWNQGSGDYESVAAMEEEFDVYKGGTTINAQWEEDYGKPTRFADPAKNYDVYFIKYKKTTPSMAFANESAHAIGYEIIIAEAGGTLAGVLDTNFGL